MKNAMWILVLVLVVLHQDNWNWTKDTLVFGFVPVGLAWHAGISIAASAVWFFATQVAWPEGLEVPANEGSGEEASA